MKFVVTAAIAVLSLTTVAHATDLPSKKHAPAAPVIANAASKGWTGLYVGVFGGSGRGASDFNAGTEETDSYLPGSIPTIAGTSHTSGSLYGLQIGYDMELGNGLVAGVV